MVYQTNVYHSLWDKSQMDDLKGKYQRNSHVLKSEIDDTPEDNIDHTKM